jgi:membrane protease YdiL (CAAX protease family)
MNAQLASSNLRKESAVQPNWLQHLGLFILFLVCEAAIFIFGSNYFDVYPTNKNLNFNLILTVVFLVVALWFKLDQRLNKFWQIVFALFIASAVTTTTSLIGGWNVAFLGWFSAVEDTSKGQAINKVYETLMVVLPILVLVKLSGADLGSIFLKRGNLKLGLSIGALVFFFLATATFMFAVERFTSADMLVAAVIWGLVFSFVNSFMEELWLRGIFLKRFAPLIGINGAVWVTSLIFALMHSFAFYFDPFALTFFAVNTLALGLGCGYLMMKSDNIWGAMLIHAASDFFLFVAVLANA